ncbi:MAG: acetyl-coenzyme A synthetase N-terminal domain-containing protein, partial [Chloroflexota bacterium]
MEPPNDGIAWRPSPEHIQRSRLSQLVRRLGCTSADDLRQRAAADPTWFWAATIEDLGIRWTRPPSQVVDLSNGKPWATWFPGAGFNYTTSAIDRWARDGRADAPALVW